MRGFDPACRRAGNGVEVAGGGDPPYRPGRGGHKGRLARCLACGEASEVRVVDADPWKAPAALLASAGDSRAMAVA